MFEHDEKLMLMTHKKDIKKSYKKSVNDHKKDIEKSVFWCIQFSMMSFIIKKKRKKRPWKILVKEFNTSKEGGKIK